MSNCGRAIEFKKEEHGAGLGPGRRPIVKRQGHLVAVEIDLERAVDRFSNYSEFVERGFEQAPLHVTADNRDQDDEARMQRLPCIKLPEIARVVGDEDEIAFAGVARNIPVLPASPANARDMSGFMAGFPGYSDKVDGEAFVDQKPHDTVIASSSRRLRRTGC